jgi:(R,R)-butanediol dehydrogenase/meso-butanediol dehydrogenase/diacetyl reductase
MLSTRVSVYRCFQIGNCVSRENLRAAIWHAATDVRIEHVAEPSTLAQSEVVVKVEYAAICASDLAEYIDGPHMIPVREPHPLTGKMAPLTLGHEFSGCVVAIGELVTRVRVGDRVCGDACLRCQRCYWCLRGQYNICALGASIGLHADGAFANYIVVPDYSLENVPAEVSLKHAALVEPLAVGLHALKRSGVQPGDTVTVVGFGMVGAAAALLANRLGATVYVVDIRSERRQLALALGAAEAFDPANANLPREIRSRTNGAGSDLVVDSSGDPTAIATSIELARRGGKIALVGIPHGASSTDLSRLVFFERELIGALGYQFDHTRILKMLASKSIDIDALMSSPIGLGDLVTDGFERMRRDPSVPLRILVQPSAL